MTEFTSEAAKMRNDYLRKIRAYVGASTTADPDEVQADVLEHIEQALSEAEQPVSVEVLSCVLEQLGKPEQWLQEDELSWWRKMIIHLRTGPEDWRLAYLSLGVLIVGTLLACPFGLIASFLLSRAAISLVGEPDPPAKKWLIYPSLIITYFLIGLFGLFVLLWPAYALGGLIGELNHTCGSPLYKEPFFDNDGLGTILAVLTSAAVGLSIWWSVLWIPGGAYPNVIRVIFRPFAENWTGRIFGKIIVIVWGLTAVLAVATILLWVNT